MKKIKNKVQTFNVNKVKYSIFICTFITIFNLIYKTASFKLVGYIKTHFQIKQNYVQFKEHI